MSRECHKLFFKENIFFLKRKQEHRYIFKENMRNGSARIRCEACVDGSPPQVMTSHGCHQYGASDHRVLHERLVLILSSDDHRNWKHAGTPRKVHARLVFLVHPNPEQQKPPPFQIADRLAPSNNSSCTPKLEHGERAFH